LHRAGRGHGTCAGTDKHHCGRRDDHGRTGHDGADSYDCTRHNDRDRTGGDNIGGKRRRECLERHVGNPERAASTSLG
jgi:hypothetical protein